MIGDLLVLGALHLESICRMCQRHISNILLDAGDWADLRNALVLWASWRLSRDPRD